MYMIANRLCMVDGVQNRLHVGTRAKTLRGMYHSWFVLVTLTDLVILSPLQRLIVIVCLETACLNF